jgi:hypothetical protein
MEWINQTPIEDAENTESSREFFRGRYRTADGVDPIPKFVRDKDGNGIVNPEWVDAPFEEIFHYE